MLIIALAAQIAAAQPTNFETWFREGDLPLHQFPSDGDHAAAYRLTIRPDGKMQSCEIEVSSGLPAIDRLTCNLIRRRARVKPATGLDGAPSYGVIRSSTVWAVNPERHYTRPVDIEMTVTTLPEGEKSPAAIAVVFASDRKEARPFARPHARSRTPLWSGSPVPRSSGASG